MIIFLPVHTVSAWSGAQVTGAAGSSFQDPDTSGAGRGDAGWLARDGPDRLVRLARVSLTWLACAENPVPVAVAPGPFQGGLPPAAATAAATARATGTPSSARPRPVMAKTPALPCVVVHGRCVLMVIPLSVRAGCRRSVRRR